MSKVIHIKLTRMSPGVGPFSIYDQDGTLLGENVTSDQLIQGMHYNVESGSTVIRILSTGKCIYEKIVNLGAITQQEFNSLPTEQQITGCLWRHLDNQQVYNKFYGKIEPYVIEYPFAYQYQDEILQNVKEYTKAFKYGVDEYTSGNPVNVVETDDYWYNKAIIYNGQQNSGLLELVPKPKHNLKLYNTYPIYGTDSKTIIFTKSDNFYNYNTFWNVQVNKSLPAFQRTCENLSIDKELDQRNMDYSNRSYKKEPIRAKDLKVRHILDNRSDVHLVSQFIFAPSQISYK